MDQPIQNKVASSGIVTIDPEEYYVSGDRIMLDIAPWLYEGIILKEKQFREHLEKHNWNSYQDKLVAITCSEDAIVPTWAYMLVAAKLQSFAKHLVYGDLMDLEKDLFSGAIRKLNPIDFAGARVVIKGCSKVAVPIAVYAEITRLLKPVVKSIFYGEPCSTVPVYKAAK